MNSKRDYHNISIKNKLIHPLRKCIFNLKYYHIKLILMLILCNYDACYHSFMNFLHWHALLLKSTFLYYLVLIRGFIDV